MIIGASRSVFLWPVVRKPCLIKKALRPHEVLTPTQYRYDLVRKACLIKKALRLYCPLISGDYKGNVKIK